MLDVFLKGVSEDIYIASTMKKYNEPSITHRDQWGNIVDPVQMQKEKEEREKAKKEEEKKKKPVKKDAK